MTPALRARVLKVLKVRRPLGTKGHGFAVGCGLLAQAGCVEGLRKKVQRVVVSPRAEFL